VTLAKNGTEAVDQQVVIAEHLDERVLDQLAGAPARQKG
jgi:hypothetical protein